MKTLTPLGLALGITGLVAVGAAGILIIGIGMSSKTVPPPTEEQLQVQQAVDRKIREEESKKATAVEDAKKKAMEDALAGYNVLHPDKVLTFEQFTGLYNAGLLPEQKKETPVPVVIETHPIKEGMAAGAAAAATHWLLQ